MEPSFSRIEFWLKSAGECLAHCRARQPLKSKKQPPNAVHRLQELFAELHLLRRFYTNWYGQYLRADEVATLEPYGQPADWPAKVKFAIREALICLVNDYEILSCGQIRDGSNIYGLRKRERLDIRTPCVFREIEIQQLKLVQWLKQRKATG